MKQLLLIDQEFGAGASTIGEKIAKRLGWNFFDQELTAGNRAAGQNSGLMFASGAWNAMTPFLQRLVNVIWRGSFDRNLPSPDLAILDSKRLASLLQQ